MTITKVIRNKPLNGLFKKTTLSLLLSSSLLMAVEIDQAQLALDIAEAKAQKSAAEAKLKSLEAKLPQNQDIITHVKLGYIKTDGNANTQTLATDGSFKKEWGENTASVIFDVQYGDAEGVEIKNRYFVELKYSYLFTDTLSFTYLAGYRDDRFSSFNYQGYTGPGLKWATYESNRQKLNLKGNILYSQDQFQEQHVVAPNDATLTYSAYVVQLSYKLQILDNLRLDQEISYRASFEDSNNYFVFSASSLSSKVSDIFSAGISYKVDYANEVAPGVLERDNTLAAYISLDY